MGLACRRGFLEAYRGFQSFLALSSLVWVSGSIVSARSNSWFTSSRAVAASLRRTSAWWCRPVACAALASVSVSALPHERLVAIDARMREAAARPVIVPDQVVIDHGKVFVSDTFVRACDRLGISVQPARKDTPTDKPRVAYCTSSG